MCRWAQEILQIIYRPISSTQYDEHAHACYQLHGNMNSIWQQYALKIYLECNFRCEFYRLDLMTSRNKQRKKKMSADLAKGPIQLSQSTGKPVYRVTLQATRVLSLQLLGHWAGILFPNHQSFQQTSDWQQLELTPPFNSDNLPKSIRADPPGLVGCQK